MTAEKPSPDTRARVDQDSGDENLTDVEITEWAIASPGPMALASDGVARLVKRIAGIPTHERQCAATRRDGEPCQGWVVSHSNVCSAHLLELPPRPRPVVSICSAKRTDG